MDPVPHLDFILSPKPSQDHVVVGYLLGVVFLQCSVRDRPAQTLVVLGHVPLGRWHRWALGGLG